MNRFLQLNCRPLQVMKFGGTSVGDASAIERVAQIVREAAHESNLAVVVSAMSGVTNQLLEAAMQAAAGNRDAVQSIFKELRARHRAAIGELIHSIPERGRINLQVEQIFEQGERWCEGTALLGELTPHTRDAISSLGERLAAPIVAATLTERGVSSESIEATQLIRTDANHGSAEPDLEKTRELCQDRLRPLFARHLTPVVTGFIGATGDGILTTLGRGGSDYSATILSAALDADAVTIWTDVDGMMTADPRLVPDAVTIAEISYQEAAELARCGAKVLHPKTLRPIAERGIPLSIRNTFAPENKGTRITAARTNTSAEAAITGLAAMKDTPHAAVATITAVGRNLNHTSALNRVLATQNLNLLSVPDQSYLDQPDCSLSFSFVVAQQDVKTALAAIHREFRLHTQHQQAITRESETLPAGAVWLYQAPTEIAAD
jgi:bifunctional aspartokinase / homoserine dehydrogenase 1